MSFEDLATERRNPRRIDGRSTGEILRLINEEDSGVPMAVGRVIDEIARAVDAMHGRLTDEEARLIYVGAGSSGRIGVMDASELKPTFNFDRALAIMAGGMEAFLNAREASEDDEGQGAEAVRDAGVGVRDCVIGLTASGRTPFTIGALREAKSRGALTVLVSCDPGVRHGFDHEIAIDVGPEVIAGSTRMKSGTAQKLVLNMISTALMVRMGKVYRNMMVDVTPKNEKLVDRAIRIIAECAGVDRDTAGCYLEESGRNAKTAIVMIRMKASRGEAEAMLRERTISEILGD
jgi:N-acetylmuramic acid 6-phosphate etherase